MIETPSLPVVGKCSLRKRTHLLLCEGGGCLRLCSEVPTAEATAAQSESEHAYTLKCRIGMLTEMVETPHLNTGQGWVMRRKY